MLNFKNDERDMRGCDASPPRASCLMRSSTPPRIAVILSICGNRRSRFAGVRFRVWKAVFQRGTAYFHKFIDTDTCFRNMDRVKHIIYTVIGFFILFSFSLFYFISFNWSPIHKFYIYFPALIKIYYVFPAPPKWWIRMGHRCVALLVSLWWHLL